MYFHAKVILSLIGVLILTSILYLFRAHLPEFPRLSTHDTEAVASPSVDAEDTDSEQTAAADDSAEVRAPSRAFKNKLAKAEALFEQGKLMNARKIAENILMDPKVQVYSAEWRQTATFISRVNTIFLFTDAPCEDKASYTVESGDNLIRIANRFHSTVSLIQKSNKLDETNPTIYPNQVFRIYQGDWRITVSKQHFVLLLHDGDRLVKFYDVGIGRQDRTPVGEFRIDLKEYEPDWWQPGQLVEFGDPANVLGTRWMALAPIEDTDKALKGYGIHGTWIPESIGTAASQGCIRMVNADVEELYDIVPVGVRVEIHE